jgi:myo-inositol-1(or 4)-monophosphatase
MIGFRFPFVAVSIGVVIHGIIAVGVVYNPILDEIYTAVRGDGAYLNHTARLPLHQRPLPSRLADCMVGVEYGAMRDANTLPVKVRSMERLAAAGQGHCHAVRCTGSAALNLCHVARGALDLYWEIGIHCWDVAAGVLILEEAGYGSVWNGAGQYALTKQHEARITPAPFNLLGRKILAIRGEHHANQTPAAAHQLATEALALLEDIEQTSD